MKSINEFLINGHASTTNEIKAIEDAIDIIRTEVEYIRNGEIIGNEDADVLDRAIRLLEDILK